MLPESRKRPHWKTKGTKLIELLKLVLKMLGAVLRLLKVVGVIANELKKLFDLFWPG